MNNRDKLESASELKLVQAYNMRNNRHAVVVQDQYGEYWVGIDLPIILKSMGPMTRASVWRGVLRSQIYGPFTDEHLAKLHAQACLVEDMDAAREYAAHTKKIIRRAHNQMWQRYHRNHYYAVEASTALGIRQNVDNTKVVGREVRHA